MLESVNLILSVLLSILGAIAIVLILMVYDLYQTLKINRSVMTPMLFTGVFTALSGMSELFEAYLGEMGVTVHGVFMLLAAISFVYGIYEYHKMLKRLQNPKI